MIVPPLASKRLLLRGPRLDDLSTLHLWRGNASLMRHLGGAQTAEKVWSDFLLGAGHWLHLGHGPWVLQDRATGRLLGEAGLFCRRRDLRLPMAEGPEVEVILAPEAQGQGLGREALTALLAWADAHLPARQSFAVIPEDHAAGLALAQGLGFGDPRPIRLEGRLTLVLRRLRAAA